MPPIEMFPSINAALNGCAALLLLIGYIFIKKRNRRAHGWTMAAAFTVSTIFLISYLYYHFHAKITTFPQIPFWRPVYLAVLLTHTILATVVAPLAVAAVILAARRRWEKHRRVARWLWPLWMYVSLTGVVIYLMLYHLFPQV